MKVRSIKGSGYAQTIALAACLIVMTLGFVRPSLRRHVFSGAIPAARIARSHACRTSLDVTDASPERLICETALVPGLALQVAESQPLSFSVALLSVAATINPAPKPPERRKLPSSRNSDSDPLA